jgi:glycyl-tRNA synthetase alpha subunit
LEYNNKPLYIQTTKSLTRQGFVKSGKKYYCDIMLDNNSETLIHWFENLEETCQSLIFEKSEAWFQNSLDKNDVETAFNPVIRIYKSGKYYLVRTNIKIGANSEPYIKIYNDIFIKGSCNNNNRDFYIFNILHISKLWI